jgi:hypothetical protein
MTKDEGLKLAIGKIKSARDCHFAAIDPLLFEAEEILEQALAAPAMQEPVTWSDYEPDGRRYPSVPDAFGTREGEHPQYIQGWNDCRAEMLKGMK